MLRIGKVLNSNHKQGKSFSKNDLRMICLKVRAAGQVYLSYEKRFLERLKIHSGNELLRIFWRESE